MLIHKALDKYCRKCSFHVTTDYDNSEQASGFSYHSFCDVTDDKARILTKNDIPLTGELDVPLECPWKLEMLVDLD